MVKKRFLLMMLLAVLCAASGTAQKFRMNRQMLRLEGNFVQKTPVSNQTCIYMDDITITAGETKTVTAYLRSVEPMWMLQCYFNLPTGMTATGAELTSSFRSLVNNNSGFSLSDGTLDGLYRVVLANLAKTTSIPAVDGQSVFTFDLTAPATMAAGNYVLSTIDFKFVSATSDEGEGYIGASTSCRVTVVEPLATGIALNQQSISLQQGSTQTLTATVTPSNASQTVSWSSSNNAVATVNASGKVTAVGVGSCTVTATTTDGTQLGASCQVNVTPVMVTGITLNSTSATIYPGDDLQLTATVSPSNATNKAVTWRSSNTAVATVDATGKVTAKAVGSCSITATATDGSGKSASCAITVAPILATSVSLNRTSASIDPGQTVQLTATVLPANVTNNAVTWRSSNTTVATVDQNGKVTGKTPGSCTITCTTADGSNKTATCAITVKPYLATSITLENDEMEVFVGDTVQMHATVLPAEASQVLNWTSSKRTVATIDSNGQLIAVGEGMTVVVVSTTDGTNLNATGIVTVKPVKATGISLSETRLNMELNETATLTAILEPANTTVKAVNWTSSNTAVATVDQNGNVTANAVGTAVITAATTDGTNLSATCQVTVKGVRQYGDINDDGVVDIADVNILINLMQGKEDPRASAETADVTGDGVVDIADVNAVINAMLGKVVEGVQTFTVDGVSFKMVKVEGGTFTMGATAEQGSDAGDREKPAHQVTLSSYSIGQTEVTQELWQAVMGSNPSSFTGDLQRPVEMVNWDDCQTFISKLNQMTGKNFRLPTEAEWEYAARGGNRSQGYKYAGSDNIDDVAWYWDNIPSQSSGTAGYGTQTVATKAPNELGLYDMSGNVYEWCQDWYGSYSSDAQTDPTGPATGSNRVGRGGCWGSGAKYCRVSYRSNSAPSSKGDRLGLRLAL